MFFTANFLTIKTTGTGNCTVSFPHFRKKNHLSQSDLIMKTHYNHSLPRSKQELASFYGGPIAPASIDCKLVSSAMRKAWKSRMILQKLLYSIARKLTSLDRFFGSKNIDGYAMWHVVIIHQFAVNACGYNSTPIKWGKLSLWILAKNDCDEFSRLAPTD